MSSEGSSFRIWGLTGGIASGKSTVAQLFAKNGVPSVDADQVSRELSAPGGEAHSELLKRFGTADRVELKKLIFGNSPEALQAKKDLEAILHPLIRKNSQRKLAELASSTGARIVLYEATLLIESGREKSFTGLIVVEAPRESRVQRLMERDKISREAAERMIDLQLSDAERRKHATHVIENRGSPAELEKKVKALIPLLLPQSKRGTPHSQENS
jgi:dephospho-CoA kinase